MTNLAVYGDLGTLAYDPVEDKIQCHICGRWFIYLAPHLRWKHHLTPDEYREDFGLNRTQPLCTLSLSEIHRRHFIEQGLVGTKLCFDLSVYRTHPLKRRLQGKINFSRARKGVHLRVTEKRKAAQRRNYQKLLVPESCVDCGTIVMVKPTRGKSAVCPKCRPEHKRKYMLRWADANRERLHEYWRDYDLNRRHRVKIG